MQRAAGTYNGSSMTFPSRAALLLPCLFVPALPLAHAARITLSAQALERTLHKQLFSGAGGRYYLRGSADHGCSVTVEDPHLSFAGGRIQLRLHTVAQLGATIGGECVGVHFAQDVEVSMLPVAEGESIGFNDVRIEHLSGSSDLDFLLTPFLSRKIPSTLKVNAAALLRKVLARSNETTGYTMTLDRFEVQSMQVDDDKLVLAVDGDLRIE
jgi:hypothetical protein